MAFSLKLVTNNLFKLIPEGFVQKRIKNGTFKIDSNWSRGELRKVSLDGKELPLDSKERGKCENLINEILQNSYRYRKNFSGKITFAAYMTDGEISELKWEASNKIITKNSNYKQKVHQGK